MRTIRSAEEAVTVDLRRYPAVRAFAALVAAIAQLAFGLGIPKAGFAASVAAVHPSEVTAMAVTHHPGQTPATHESGRAPAKHHPGSPCCPDCGSMPCAPVGGAACASAPGCAGAPAVGAHAPGLALVTRAARSVAPATEIACTHLRVPESPPPRP